MAQSGSDSTYIPSSRPSSTALVRAADPNRVAHFVEDSTDSAAVVAMEEQRKLRGCVVGKVRDRHANERDQNPLSLRRRPRQRVQAARPREVAEAKRSTTVRPTLHTRRVTRSIRSRATASMSRANRRRWPSARCEPIRTSPAGGTGARCRGSWLWASAGRSSTDARACSPYRTYVLTTTAEVLVTKQLRSARAQPQMAIRTGLGSAWTPPEVVGRQA